MHCKSIYWYFYDGNIDRQCLDFCPKPKYYASYIYVRFLFEFHIWIYCYFSGCLIQALLEASMDTNILQVTETRKRT